MTESEVRATAAADQLREAIREAHGLTKDLDRERKALRADLAAFRDEAEKALVAVLDKNTTRYHDGMKEAVEHYAHMLADGNAPVIESIHDYIDKQCLTLDTRSIERDNEQVDLLKTIISTMDKLISRVADLERWRAS